MERAGMWPELPPSGVGPILASITCDYRLPLTYPDTVKVGARVTRIGRSSFRMEHVIFSEGAQKIAAEIVSTMVLLDYGAGKPTRVPEESRRAMEALEGRELGD
jgi:acyl-CoA thioester hydrolase